MISVSQFHASHCQSWNPLKTPRLNRSSPFNNRNFMVYKYCWFKSSMACSIFAARHHSGKGEVHFGRTWDVIDMSTPSILDTKSSNKNSRYQQEDLDQTTLDKGIDSQITIPSLIPKDENPLGWPSSSCGFDISPIIHLRLSCRPSCTLRFRSWVLSRITDFCKETRRSRVQLRSEHGLPS